MMNLFFAEMVWHKKHGNYYRINKDAVDATLEDGIDHAASLKLVESNLADVIVSPLIRKASSSLLNESR